MAVSFGLFSKVFLSIVFYVVSGDERVSGSTEENCLCASAAIVLKVLENAGTRRVHAEMFAMSSGNPNRHQN